jgi:glycosyltransferase involved in cell wall biosynthesis
MKTVLIIAHLSHATPRIPNIAKYFPEFGWQVIIITAPVGKKPDLQCRIIETGYRDTFGFWKRLFQLDQNEDIRGEVKKRLGAISNNSIVDYFLTLGGAVINYPDADKGWTSFALKEADKILQHEEVDAIISSSSPVTCHIIAWNLKKKYNLPWVADIRDLWSQNHNYGYGPLRKFFDKRLELKTLSNADVLITVSQPWVKKLNLLHIGKKIFSITNGYDPATLNTSPIELTTKFTITYTGIIYEGKQNPIQLFSAIHDLIIEKIMDPDDIEVRFYGSTMPWLDIKINQYGLLDIVKQYGRVPQQIAIEKQRESQILLHLTWEGQGERASYSLKLFEYLAAQRPIIAIGLGNDMTEELLFETKSGFYAPEKDDIKTVLTEMYMEYKKEGTIGYYGDMNKINTYSYYDLTKKYGDILSTIHNQDCVEN